MEEKTQSNLKIAEQSVGSQLKIAEQSVGGTNLKIYTKKGDEGKTSLCDVGRISKSDLTFDLLGDLDELSASIGLLVAHVPSLEVSNLDPKDPKNVVRILRRIQHLLLDMGSNIATVSRRKKVVHTPEDEVKLLESCIDFYTDACPKLTDFILPGYTLADSHAHLCRSVARRVERNLWKLNTQVNYLEKEVHLFQYLNRLSDFFFALARYLCVVQGKNEVTRKEYSE